MGSKAAVAVCLLAMLSSAPRPLWAQSSDGTRERIRAVFEEAKHRFSDGERAAMTCGSATATMENINPVRTCIDLSLMDSTFLEAARDAGETYAALILEERVFGKGGELYGTRLYGDLTTMHMPNGAIFCAVFHIDCAVFRRAWEPLEAEYPLFH